MHFKEIANYVGVSSYPDKFDEIFLSQNFDNSKFYNEEYYREIENEYEILGEYFDMVMNAIKKIKEDENLYIYGNVFCEYAKSATTTEVRCAPMPVLDESLARDFFPVPIMYSTFPASIESLKRRGYSRDEIKVSLHEVSRAIESSKKLLGRPLMMALYYNWSMLYVYGEIFPCGGFTFQLKQLDYDVVILQNKKTLECVPVMTDGIFHENGQKLGTVGAEDEEKSFKAYFEETDGAYKGYKVVRGKITKEKVEYKKDEWECILKQGDKLLSVHIPRNTDVTHDAVTRDFNMALEKAKYVFPDYNLKYLMCVSWLLDLSLEELLGENSKIVSFGNEYLRFPVKSNGEEHKIFVYSGFKGENKDLPEETSLQRKIKAHLLSGGHILGTAGVYVPKK